MSAYYVSFTTLTWRDRVMYLLSDKPETHDLFDRCKAIENTPQIIVTDPTPEDLVKIRQLEPVSIDPLYPLQALKPELERAEAEMVYILQRLGQVKDLLTSTSLSQDPVTRLVQFDLEKAFKAVKSARGVLETAKKLHT